MAHILTHNGLLDAQAISQAAGDPDLANSLSDGEPSNRAAAAIACALGGNNAAIPALINMLDDDGICGQAAAWALAVLNSEAALLEIAAKGGLDQREHAYLGLAIIAARGHASVHLGDAMVERVGEEVARAKAGKTGLGEHANRVLAVLGDERTETMAQALIESDPYTDRFELQRQRKAVAGGNRDQESIARLSDWTALLADHLHIEPAPQPEAISNTGDAIDPNAATADLSEVVGGIIDDQAIAEGDELEPPPISAADFLASESGKTLEPQFHSLLTQVLPMLQQLSTQAVGVPLEHLRAQEFAAIILQVLPQALPPQYVQALLSPPAINALHKLFSWYADNGGEPELREGMRLVRSQLQQQIRASGMLGGPDYSEPTA